MERMPRDCAKIRLKMTPVPWRSVTSLVVIIASASLMALRERGRTFRVARRLLRRLILFHIRFKLISRFGF